MNTDIQKHYRSFIYDLCSSHKPEFAVTVTLKRLYADDIALRAFNFFMKSLQKPIRNDLDERGLAFIERTWKNARYENQLHMHSLIWGVNEWAGEPETDLRRLVEKSASRLRDDQGRQMADMSTICVQNVYDSDNLFRYDTKDMLRWSPDRRTHVYAVTPQGLDLSCQLNGSAERLQRDNRWRQRPQPLTPEQLAALH